MQLALIGFDKSGKTTVFNALTGSHAEVSAFSGKTSTHRATVTVPDPRLDQLNDLFQSKKLVHATIDYIDPVGLRRDRMGQGAGLGDEMLNTIATADALVAVIRAFQADDAIPTDPEGDCEAIALEILLSDLQKVEHRLERVAAQVQRIGGPDKKRLEDEKTLMERLKTTLESGTPIREIELSEEEGRIIRSFQFLTTKPLLIVANMGDDASGADALLERLAQAAPSARFIALSGNTEMEIAQLDPEERGEFLASYGIREPGASRMIRLSYETLGLISFFTVGPTEAHAWTLRRGSSALEAAGAIHSDLARGFIRAQVISWSALLEAGNFAEARKKATLRTEGKTYIVQDGDVIEILFSV